MGQNALGWVFLAAVGTYGVFIAKSIRSAWHPAAHKSNQEREKPQVAHSSPS